MAKELRGSSPTTTRYETEAEREPSASHSASGSSTRVLESGKRTADLWRGDKTGKTLLGTRAMGDAVVAALATV